MKERKMCCTLATEGVIFLFCCNSCGRPERKSSPHTNISLHWAFYMMEVLIIMIGHEEGYTHRNTHSVI